MLAAAGPQSWIAVTGHKNEADSCASYGLRHDLGNVYELIAETMKLFGNSAYGITVTNKENFVSTSYGNEDNISKNIKSPHFQDFESLYDQKYEVISKKGYLEPPTAHRHCSIPP